MSKLKITEETKADIYLQLARLDEAGFPVSQAFELLLKTNKNSGTQLQKMLRFVKAGKAVADSGYRAGIFSRSDKELLSAGEVAGNLGIIYKQLANYYAQKVKRAKKIKSQCYLPLAVLIIALFVQPLPELILNKISGLDYLLITVGRLFKVALFIYILLNLPFWLTRGRLQFLGFKSLIYSLQLKLPFISSWVITRQVNEFLRSLGLMLTAGMPILEALPKSLNTISNPLLRKQFDQVILATQQGGSLTDVLAKVSEVDNQAIQLLLVGEKSGKLSKTMLHHTKIEKEKTDLQEDLLAEWVPRIFYFLVSAWVASSLFASNTVYP